MVVNQMMNENMNERQDQIWWIENICDSETDESSGTNNLSRASACICFNPLSGCLLLMTHLFVLCNKHEFSLSQCSVVIAGLAWNIFYSEWYIELNLWHWLWQQVGSNCLLSSVRTVHPKQWTVGPHTHYIEEVAKSEPFNKAFSISPRSYYEPRPDNPCRRPQSLSWSSRPRGRSRRRAPTQGCWAWRWGCRGWVQSRSSKASWGRRSSKIQG